MYILKISLQSFENNLHVGLVGLSSGGQWRKQKRGQIFGCDILKKIRGETGWSQKEK